MIHHWNALTVVYSSKTIYLNIYFENTAKKSIFTVLLKLFIH